jgi:hypothetical protein
MATIVTALWGMQAWIVVSPTAFLPVDMDIVPMDAVNVILVGKATTVVLHFVDLDTINFHTCARAAFYLLVILLLKYRQTTKSVNLIKLAFLILIPPTLIVILNGLVVASSHGSTANVTALLCLHVFLQRMLALTLTHIRLGLGRSVMVPFHL